MMTVSGDLKKLFDAWSAVDVLRRSINTTNTTTTIVRSLPEHRRTRLADRTLLSIEGVTSLFTPKPVNPSKEAITSFIKKTHVWSHENGDIINSSPDALRDFVDSTIEQVTNARKAVEGCVPTDRLCIRILGEKGIGKTHLQNYIISKYYKAFEAEQIVWIRVNMIRNFGDSSKLNLNDWIRAQLAKVLCRYFDPASLVKQRAVDGIDRDWKAPLTKYVEGIQGITETRRNHMFDQVETMVERFRDKNKDSGLDPSWAPTHLVDEIWRAAMSAGLGVIVIIDGLDLLSSSVTAKEEFANKSAALQKYLVEKTCEPVLNLIFQRPASLTHSIVNQKVSDHRQYSPNHSRRSMRAKVGCVRGRSLFSARMKYAAKLPEYFQGMTSSNLRRFENFVKKEKSGLTDKNGKDLTFMRALETFSDGNARSAIQLLFVAAARFSAPEMKEYEFTERAMMGTEAYPPNTYLYQKGIEEAVERIAGPDYRQFDVLHLPSIFEYPIPGKEPASVSYGDLGPTVYLLGLRILQLIHVYGPVEGKEVLEAINEVFQYPAHRGALLLEEFFEYEILRPLDPDGSFAGSVEDTELSLTPKGQLILDHYLYDVTYLGISAMTGPMPETCVAALRGRKAILAHASCAIDSTEDWVHAKIKNSFTLATLLIEGNEQQKNNMQKSAEQRRNKSKNRMVRDLVDGKTEIFSFPARLRDEIPAIAARVLNGMSPREKRREVLAKLTADNKSFQISK